MSGNILGSVLGLHFLLLSNFVVAAPQVLGDWIVDTNVPGESYLYAYTINDSGHTIGQYCYPSDSACVWLLGMSTSCEVDSEYWVLVNSDSGATSLKLLCRGEIQDGKYAYAFSNFDDIDQVIRHSKRIGFAIPLQNDRFTVIRFDISGSYSALSVMRAVAEERARVKPSTRNTRDQRL